MRLPSSPKLLSGVALPLLLSACALGPDYQAPQPRIATSWSGEAQAGAVESGAWWKDLNDPMLDALIEDMLTRNPDLREAQARLAEARANQDAVRGGRLPQVSTSASANQMVLSENGQLPIGQIPGVSRDFGLFDVGFDASWEIDLWGRQARQREAAQARTQAAALSVEGTRLQLIAELARAYVNLRLTQSDEASARESLALRKQLADLTGLLAKAGEVSQIEANRTQSDADSAQLSLSDAQASTRAAALQVARLVGAQPADLLARLEVAGAIPLPPAAIGAGLPSELLRRRPDILAAERELAASSADIGVARADQFPRLSLGLAFGQQARVVSDLLDSESSRLQAGPSLLWPIFNGGRARAMVRAADARAQGAAARYDAAVIGALTDSETAINRFDRSLAAYKAAQAAAEQDEAIYRLARQRQQAGEDDRIIFARAGLTRLAATQQLARTQAGAVESSIALHKALGGGWNPDQAAVDGPQRRPEG